MDKRLLYVYNPNAGKGLIVPKLHEVVDMFIKDGFRVEIYPTQGTKDAIRVVEENASQYDIVACSGGDGTLDEVVTGMIRSGAKKPIGYIPVGTTNDYASSLNISKDVKLAAHEIVLGTPHFLDVGRFNQDYFVYIAAFGIFTEVSYATDQNFKKLFGHMAYLLEGIKSLTDIKSYNLKVDIDGEVYEGDFIYGMVTNSQSVGGFKHLTGKNVELDDGLFEVTLIKMPKNVLEMTEIITSLLAQEDKTDLIISCKAKKVKVMSESPVSWTRDGEFGGEYTEVLLENMQHAMSILLVDEAGMDETVAKIQDKKLTVASETDVKKM